MTVHGTKESQSAPFAAGCLYRYEASTDVCVATTAFAQGASQVRHQSRAPPDDNLVRQRAGLNCLPECITQSGNRCDAAHLSK